MVPGTNLLWAWVYVQRGVSSILPVFLHWQPGLIWPIMWKGPLKPQSSIHPNMFELHFTLKLKIFYMYIAPLHTCRHIIPYSFQLHVSWKFGSKSRTIQEDIFEEYKRLGRNYLDILLEGHMTKVCWCIGCWWLIKFHELSTQNFFIIISH